MKYYSLDMNTIQVQVDYSSFLTGNDSSEYYVVFSTKKPNLSIKQIKINLEVAIKQFSADFLQDKAILVWKRYFLSDPVNQMPVLNIDIKDPHSYTGQPSLDKSKIVVLCYFVEGGESINKKNEIVHKRSNYVHYFYNNIHDTFSTGEYLQSCNIFKQLHTSMHQENLTFLHDLIRTWIYINDVDNRYMGMVKARNEIFEQEGLCERTHFVASTGIEGYFHNPKVFVHLDAYAIKGLQTQQIKFLRASEFLSPTTKYGVAFERGTAIEYGDRKHLYISGTASIDKHGEIVHLMDILSQTKRTIQNISALLEEGGANIDTDLTHLIIYLRDFTDYEIVKTFLEKTLPEIPKIYLKAAVCRPGWLIEIECSAIIENANTMYQPF